MATIKPIGIDSVTGQGKVVQGTDVITGGAIVSQNQNLKPTARIWCGQATTTSGVATFNPTSDNTSGGTALFTNIFSVMATGERNTATAIQVPFAALKTISADKKTVTVNLMNGRNLGALGDTITAAPDGTNVHLVIIGD